MRRAVLSLVVAFLLIYFSGMAFAGNILVRAGSRGSSVREVQELLIEKGYLNDIADGVAGPKTVAAIKDFQKSAGLTVDGVCGNGTYRALTGHDYEGVNDSLNLAGSRVMYVSATAYSAQDPGLSAYTASGTRVRHGVIAVDTSVIPLGTRVFIPGYGEAIAEDIGGGVRGNHIDIAFDTHAEALLFGWQELQIFILD